MEHPESKKIVNGLREFGGPGDNDTTLRMNGLKNAADNAYNHKKSRRQRVHLRRVIPRVVFCSGRQVGVKSEVFYNDNEEMKQSQKEFELLMDFLSFSDEEPEPSLVTVNDDGYFSWLLDVHERYYSDKSMGQHWMFVKDLHGLRLLATAKQQLSSGETVASHHSQVSNVSHIEKESNCPGELSFDADGCEICLQAIITDEGSAENKPLYVKFPEEHTLRCTSNMVVRGDSVQTIGDSLTSVNLSQKSLFWEEPPRVMTKIYHNKIKCQQISKIYKMVYEYLLSLKRKEDHEEEKRIQAEMRARGESVSYDGVVTKDMIREAERTIGDDKVEVSSEDVFKFFRDKSNASWAAMGDKAPRKHKSAFPIGNSKIDLGKLCHMLSYEPLPGFDDPIPEREVHAMFQELEPHRDAGITKTIFKNFIVSAQNEEGVDFLDKKNTFAHLLTEERERRRGMLFDRYDNPQCSVNLADRIFVRTKFGKVVEGNVAVVTDIHQNSADQLQDMMKDDEEHIMQKNMELANVIDRSSPTSAELKEGDDDPNLPTTADASTVGSDNKMPPLGGDNKDYEPVAGEDGAMGGEGDGSSQSTTPGWFFGIF